MSTINKVEFNGLSGFGRRPIAHTCDSILELPTSYANYEDFYGEFKAIIDAANDTGAWMLCNRSTVITTVFIIMYCLHYHICFPLSAM